VIALDPILLLPHLVMKTLACAALLSSVFACLPVRAEARVVRGSSVRVAIDGHREAGIGLRSDGRGWRLPLAGSGGVTSVVLVDVTAPNHEKWVLAVQAEDGPLTLDGARFVGGHAYRVEIRRGAAIVDRALVYLYPARGGKNTRVEFDVDGADSIASNSEDDIRLTPKSAL